MFTNKGVTQTVIYGNEPQVHNVGWSAEYDGNKLNVDVNTVTNGEHKHLDFKLSNDDLMNMLNRQSINMPIDKRLEIDFFGIDLHNKKKRKTRKYKHHKVKSIHTPITNHKVKKSSPPKSSSIYELVGSNYLTSPMLGEDYIVPLSLERNSMDKYTLTPKRRHKRAKSHITHKVYKAHHKTPHYSL